jgi:hypothetical protein
MRIDIAGHGTALWRRRRAVNNYQQMGDANAPENRDRYGALDRDRHRGRESYSVEHQYRRLASDNDQQD